MLSDWTSFSENWTNDWEALSSRFQQQTGAKFARCPFSDVNWHQTESCTRKFATALICTVIAFRITGQS